MWTGINLQCVRQWNGSTVFHICQESANQEPKKKFDKKGPPQKGKQKQFDKQQNRSQPQKQPNKFQQQKEQNKRHGQQEEVVSDIKPYKRKVRNNLDCN